MLILSTNLATVKMLVIKDPDDESDDLDEDMNMVDLVGEESGGESSDDENGEVSRKLLRNCTLEGSKLTQCILRVPAILIKVPKQ